MYPSPKSTLDGCLPVARGANMHTMHLVERLCEKIICFLIKAPNLVQHLLEIYGAIKIINHIILK